MCKRMVISGVFGAVSLSALVAATSVHAGAPQATDAKHRGVVSNGMPVPTVEVSRTFSPSSPGRLEEAFAPRDRRSNRRAGAETPSETSALMAKRAVGAPLGQESIIGTDTRTLVRPTTSYPARATVLITFSAGRCTGWLINANTVVTAGHCVHPGGGGSFYPTSSYLVYPGRDGTSSPYGSCTARWLASVNGWTANRDDRYDYGVVKLNCTIGNTTGWYGYFTSASLTGLPTIINGYPGDKPLTQWRSTDSVRVTDTRRVFYQNDTLGGQSGAPVYYNRSGCGICAMAVHAYGTYGSPPFSTNNHGTRITQDVFNNLTAWKNAP
jgi:glutamyl endopeptidase